GSAEPAGRRAWDGDPRHDIEAGGDLPVARAAAVAVALEPAADVHEEALAHLALETGVAADAVAAAVERVGRLEPREHLGTGFLRLAGRGRVEVDAAPAAAVAELPGRLVTGVDAVLLAPELAARHERERPQRASDVQRAHHVEVPDRLAEDQPARVERGGARRAHRGVVRVLDEIMP